jgi:hypothetical protein
VEHERAAPFDAAGDRAAGPVGADGETIAAGAPLEGRRGAVHVLRREAREEPTR